jgi:acetylcholinesterase
MLPLALMLLFDWSTVDLVLNHGKMVLLTACKHLAITSAILSTAAATSAVTLPGYGSFVGTTVNQTLTKKALLAPVDAWLGIDYATQPVGKGRFAHSSPPAAFYGTKNATQYGFSCVQDPEDLTYPQDEACLSMNVYRPKNVSSSEKVPVLIWIHGVSQTEAFRYANTNILRVALYKVAQEASTALHLFRTRRSQSSP